MNTEHLSDKDLVTRIRTGHPDLFGPLVERHIRAAHAIAYARLGNVAGAEDAVQESFLRAYEGLATLRDPAKFSAWLLTIARHEAARVAAKRNRPPVPSAAADSPEASTESVSSMHSTPDPAQHELNGILRDHVMRLPEPAREVLLLHYFAGRSAREIAELLTLRRAAVLKRLQRAREQLAETLLRDIEAVRPTRESLAPQVARIAALALALPAVDAAALSGSLLAPVSAFAASKLPVAVSLLVAAGAAIAYGILRASDTPTADHSVPIPVAQPSAPLPGPESDPVAQIPGPVAAAPAPSESAPLVQAFAPVAPRGPVEAKDLSSVWRAFYLANGGSNPAEQEMDYVQFTQRGYTIDIGPAKNHPSSWKGQGNIRNGNIIITLRMNRGSVCDTEVFKLEGPVELGADQFITRGEATYPETPCIRTFNGQEQVVNPQTQPAVIKWYRVSPETLTKEAYARARKAELQRLGDAIRRYRRANAGKLPPRLQDLVPNYIADLRPFGEESGVTLRYMPLPPRKSLEDVFPTYPRDVTGEHPNFGEGKNMQQRMIACEDALKERWGDRFISHIILEVRYPEYQLVLYMNEDGSTGAPGEIEPMEGTDEPGHSATEAERNQTIGLCQNHMKQAGLSLKMFGQESPEHRFSAGWMMMYPEYLPDRGVLLCPAATKPEVSYDILFPAVTSGELEMAYSKLFNTPSSAASNGSRIPIVIETGECGHSGGHNVLFLDGHTEHIKGRLEDNPKLAPFLNLH